VFAFTVRRLLQAVPVWLFLSVVAFGLMHLSSGSPAAVMLGVQATPEQIARVEAQLGLDRPLPEQYLRWLGRALQGDFGRSYFLNDDVVSAIGSRFGVTLALTVGGFLIAFVLGLALGTLAATRRSGPADGLVTTLASLGFAVPEFLLGLMLMLAFAIQRPWFPVQGWVPLGESPIGWLHHLVLPALAIGAIQTGPLARIVRSSLRTTLASDFVRTARAKGVPSGTILVRHALLAGALPVLTGIGLIFTALLAGAFATEIVFNLPGLGQMMLGAALNRDFPVLQAGVLFIGTLVLAVNLAVDLAYGLADPRIRHG
jgi:peptide/nickel transport system permease protein